MLTRARIQYAAAVITLLSLATAAAGYIVAPAAMLRIVAVDATPQTEFLVRTLAAPLLSMVPAAWMARRGSDPVRRAILLGFAVYMFASSIVDGWAYFEQVVGAAALPSIAVRVLLGLILLWLGAPQGEGSRA